MLFTLGSLRFQDVMHYEQLTAGVIQHDLLVDNLIYKVRSSTRHCLQVLYAHISRDFQCMVSYKTNTSIPTNQ